MANLFNSVKIRNPKRQRFNLSHSKRLTTEFGRLTPIMCEPVLPADKFSVKTTLKVRFAPMTLPVMERFKAYVHYWYVPNRILWDNWEKFITGGEDGVSDLEHPYPFIKLGSNHSGNDGGLSLNNFMSGTLFDYLGFPAKSTSFDAAELGNLARNPAEFDALPFKAYQKIYDEFYRDQNLEEAMDLHTELDGEQVLDDDNYGFVNGLMSIRYRAWKKDYFTSALPDPQRGPDVTLPIFMSGDLAVRDGSSNVGVPFKGNRVYNDEDNSPASLGLEYHASGAELGVSDMNQWESGDGLSIGGSISTQSIADRMRVDPARSASINDVRRGFALQRLYELAARVGGRYAENILGNFGVHAGDARLQRPEYLGGSVVPIYVGDVLQTSATETGEGGTPLGMPAGVAGAMGAAKEFTKTFYEHGWIIGILSIVPEAAYIQGIPRKFLKRDRLDFAWPLLANLGEQEIQNQELFFEFGKKTQNESGFGYTPRYAEYKFGLNGIHGDFRGSMINFHDARIFSSLPALNHEFISVKPTSNTDGLNRIFAVNDATYDHLWVHLFNDVLVRRKLPKYGTPI